jgi:hypothetical protein
MGEDEERRLSYGLSEGERSEVGWQTLMVETIDEPEAVLARCKQVLQIALAAASGPVWPTDSEWRALLPLWFVHTFPPSSSTVDSWTLDGWVAWLEPEMREWRWWDARVTGTRSAEVFIETPGWPCVVVAPSRWMSSSPRDELRPRRRRPVATGGCPGLAASG